MRASPLVFGPPDQPVEWDEDWRAHLVEQAEVLVHQLWAVGVTGIFLDGSFVEDKPRPNDIDGYFSVDVRRVATGELERSLNALDPHGIWTWDPAARRPYRGYTKRQLPMWHAYRVEFYPHYEQFSGIVDVRGHPLTFPSAFRTVRLTNEEKGIVRLLPDRHRQPPTP